MPKVSRPLSAVEVRRLAQAEGFHFVGEVPGLALAVSPTLAASWVLRFTVAGKRRDMGLGGFPAVSLSQARDAARLKRQQAAEGGDPLAARVQAKAAAAQAAARARTFEEVAEDYIRTNAAKWRSSKHLAQWRSTLAQHAFPAIGKTPIAELTTEGVMGVLAPIWHRIPETANRTRNRIELVWDFWDAMRPDRNGNNPARWKGRLEHLLPPARKVRKVVSHPAVPVDEVQALFAKLKAADGLGARLLEFSLLTGTRGSEARLATWAEMDMAAGLWHIPGNRTKRERPHTMPLSDEALSLLAALPRLEGCPFVFPGRDKEKPMSLETTGKALDRLKVTGIDSDGVRRPAVPHGLRSTFADWATERSGFSQAAILAAISHKVAGNASDGAYIRTGMVAERARLMQAWADFLTCKAQGGNVLPLRRSA